MKKLSLVSFTLLFSFLGIAQHKVEIKENGIAHKTIVVSESGIQDHSLIITGNASEAEFSVGFTGDESKADYVVTRHFENETIRVKTSGFGDASFKIKKFGSADLTLCIGCNAQPDVLIYLEDWGSLSQVEVIALVYRDILAIVDP